MCNYGVLYFVPRIVLEMTIFALSYKPISAKLVLFTCPIESDIRLNFKTSSPHIAICIGRYRTPPTNIH